MCAGASLLLIEYGLVMCFRMKVKVMAQQCKNNPQHVRSYPRNRIASTLAFFIVLMASVGLFASLIIWRQNSPILLDGLGVQTRGVTSGYAYGGYDPTTQVTNLGFHSSGIFQAGTVFSFVPFDVSHDLQFNAEVSFDEDANEEGLALFMKPASSSEEGWKVVQYSDQAIGMAGFSGTFGFKIDLHPTNSQQLEESSSCKAMCSPDPETLTSPFGAFVATGIDENEKVTPSRPGYLQVIKAPIATMKIHDTSSLLSGNMHPISVFWQGTTQTMTVKYLGQQWKHSFKLKADSPNGYWFAIASSIDSSRHHYVQNIKVHSLVGTVSPTAIRVFLPNPVRNKE